MAGSGGQYFDLLSLSFEKERFLLPPLFIFVSLPSGTTGGPIPEIQRLKPIKSENGQQWTTERRKWKSKMERLIKSVCLFQLVRPFLEERNIKFWFIKLVGQGGRNVYLYSEVKVCCVWLGTTSMFHGGRNVLVESMFEKGEILRIGGMMGFNLVSCSN